MINLQSLAKRIALCGLVNRWALALGPNSLAKSPNTQSETFGNGKSECQRGLASCPVLLW